MKAGSTQNNTIIKSTKGVRKKRTVWFHGMCRCDTTEWASWTSLSLSFLNVSNIKTVSHWTLANVAFSTGFVWIYSRQIAYAQTKWSPDVPVQCKIVCEGLGHIMHRHTRTQTLKKNLRHNPNKHSHFSVFLFNLPFFLLSEFKSSPPEHIPTS